MTTDQPKQGLFSSLSLGRASRNKASAETLAHPLLGASTSSVNLNDASTSQPQPESPSLSAHGRQQSDSRNVSGSGDILNVPYKPRQRAQGHGSTNSVSSINSVAGSSTSPLVTPTVATTSPITPTGISALPVTATSTTATFAVSSSSAAPAETSAGSDTLASSLHASGSSASATTRLQLQSLKAGAQKIGLGNGSMGMTILDTIFERSQGPRSKSDGTEWTEILKLLSAGKAILLLPTSAASSLPITPQILRDHIAFMAPSIPITYAQSPVVSSGASGGTASMLITLSGLVGSVRGSAVTFESALPADSRHLTAIRDLLTRQSALSVLRPTSKTSTSFISQYPTYIISNDSTILPFPPLNKSTSSASETKDVSKGPTAKLGRINPFASLFGGGSPALGSSPAASDPAPPSPSRVSFGTSTPERPQSPANPTSPPHLSSPRSSTLALDADTASIRSDITTRDAEGYQVMAYTISKPIKQNDLNKALNKAIKTTIREELERLPEKVTERVIKLVLPGVSPAYTASSDSKAEAGLIELDFSDPTVAGEKLQEFIEAIYDDLFLHFRADSSHIFGENEYSSMRRKPSWTRKGVSDALGMEDDSEEARKDRKEKARRERDEMIERKATEGAEEVEAVICRLLYNRLFSPLESDDARHDEALSSRIAALNMLDLSLDHLGLITCPDDEPPKEKGSIARGLAKIADAIGDELQRLSLASCLTPKEKGDILIRSHQLVVDGLAKLPPIDLRPEDEPYKAPRADQQPVETHPSDLSLRSILSSSSISESATSPDDRIISPPPSNSLAMRRSSSGGSSMLSTSTPSADPLASIAEVLENTPLALRTSSSTDVPQLVLPETAEASEIQEAMTDSVITVTARSSRSTSPRNSQTPDVETMTRKPKVSTSGADLILPIIIYAVVKSNPPQLASHLMYLRRYRSAICLTGEASYAIVNLTAVVEFLEHVELSQLGLGDESDKVISVEDLSPIGLNYLDESNADTASIASASSRLRGRVFQVGELAGSAADSANKVITGVVDSSWTALRGLISAPAASEVDGSSAPAPAERPGMRPRQASTFSLASVTASVATIAAAAANRSRSRANSRASAIMNQHNPTKEEHTWKGNEEMVEVTSRPESVREKNNKQSSYGSSDDEQAETSEDDDDGKGITGINKGDARSIRSVSSVLSKSRSRDAETEREEAKERVSISDRLASIGVLGRISTPPDGSTSSEPLSKAGSFLGGITSSRNASGSGHGRRLSLLGGGGSGSRNDNSASPAGSIASLPPIPSIMPSNTTTTDNIEPPIEHFMTCDVGDIRLAEIGELLRDYRRLGAIVNAMGKSAPAAT